MIQYIERYSDTNEPDKHGRWARMAIYKDVRIADIVRYETREGIRYVVKCNFPTANSDYPFDIETFEEFSDAKEYLKEAWNKFSKYITE